MKLIVGLGNPGKEYSNTRHNIGFDFIEQYLDYKKIEKKWSSKFEGLLLQTVVGNEKVLFLKPQTFMNLSGNSVVKVCNYFNITVEDVLVICDDLDLNIGNFKLKANGSCGGHNGLRDIENKLNSSEYKRLKIGISKNKQFDTKDYVLSKFSKEELKIYSDLFSNLNSILDDYFKMPFGDLMSKYNRKNR